MFFLDHLALFFFFVGVALDVFWSQGEGDENLPQENTAYQYFFFFLPTFLCG